MTEYANQTKLLIPFESIKVCELKLFTELIVVGDLWAVIVPLGFDWSLRR